MERKSAFTYHVLADLQKESQILNALQGPLLGQLAVIGLARRQMGLKTLSDHFQELGADFGEEIERRASDAKLILVTATKHRVPVEMLWKPS
jgi:hypothetical protein